MKKFIFISFGLFLLLSCGQEQSVKQNVINDTNGNVAIDTTGNAIAEKNLKMQLKEYLVAFNGGDPDKALYYIYPDIFEYLRKQYPDEKFDMQEIKDTLFIEPIRKMKKLVKEKKISYEFEIGDITKKVNYKTNKLYIVLTYVNAKVKLDKHSMGGEVIAISNDNGINWKFVQNDPETISGILKMKFPQTIIDELLTKD
jgi:hypothetical protein